MQKTLARLAWEARSHRRSLLIGGAVVAIAGLAGLVYLRRRSYLIDRAEADRWIDLAELEMRAYQQEPLATGT